MENCLVEPALVAKSVRFNGRDVEVAERELPALKDNEVRLRSEVSFVSIGTEIAWIEQQARTGAAAGLGYSNVAVIEAIGAKVPGFRVGQRVLTLLPHTSVANAEVTSDALLPVPDGLASEKAAMAILASVAMHIVERAGVRLLEPTAIIGQGVVGSLVLQFAKLCGAEPLIAIDTDAARLEQARALGAQTVNAASEDVVSRVKELTRGEGASLCIEAAGTAQVFSTAMKLLRLRGRLMVSSTVFEPVSFNIIDDFITRELSVIGAHQPKCPLENNPYYPWSQVDNRAAAMRAMLDGRIKVDHLLSHKISPQQAPELYQRLRKKDRSIVGVVIDWR